MIKFKNVNFRYEDSDRPVFSDLNLNLPSGMTTLVGQNGTGKSTFLHLAGGRLIPDSGTVTVNDLDTDQMTDEESRNHLISFIYQNMEFETDEKIGDLLPFVFDQGSHEDDSIINEIVSALELTDCLGRKYQENSKGDMQKISIAFSLLFGSPYIMMDEPVFAMEHRWKEAILDYLKDYTQKNGNSLYYSIHELDLSLKYSDNAILFNKDHSLIMGPASNVLKREYLEEAYQVPMKLLYQRENLFREHLEKPVNINKLRGQDVKILD
ncbi:ATP-binding cassette domain-containing protein [Oceanispirochaeta sp.]|jgi:ABC-type cobalamin/Fe3+-siderophores transport system ATPase subunit|uniref:ATP-binding cassette domain-containing protein n=1 Tax=Oceanispirochaeta sp. TaxID=2035350 RepID=UPI0026225D20|nr:ABC transporter ATP-binding protein [Oceanispirochaeta sp.]MDA3957355.1 ABC transporter ATP-binding protein [Oceanispirochaeta sp.]